VSTRAAMAGITSFSTCTDANTWFIHRDYIISQSNSLTFERKKKKTLVSE
jgi:hypothetical protein